MVHVCMRARSFFFFFYLSLPTTVLLSNCFSFITLVLFFIFYHCYFTTSTSSRKYLVVFIYNFIAVNLAFIVILFEKIVYGNRYFCKKRENFSFDS